ncbi:MAG TPA: RNA polymerase sigma factor [Solirubrobacteraceae bacterium]|nr:RNA polymerase sigma factor [Solirubrobacteraceae bacterium]
MGTQNGVAGADGATDRFEQLFRRHHRTVVAYVRRRAPAEAVDDIVGETFLVAWRRLNAVPERELPWLLGVARNVVATQRRGAIRRVALTRRLGSTAGSATLGSEASPTAEGVDDRLLAALAKLSAKDREALTLTAWDGLEPHEAAVVLGDTPGSFRVRLHRARKRLRGLLDERPPLASPAREHRLQVEENHS